MSWARWVRQRQPVCRSLCSDLSSSSLDNSKGPTTCDDVMVPRTGTGGNRRARKQLSVANSGKADLKSIQIQFKQKAQQLVLREQSRREQELTEATASDGISKLSIMARQRLQARDGTQVSEQENTEISETSGNGDGSGCQSQFPHQHLAKFDYVEESAIGDRAVSQSPPKGLFDRGFYTRSTVSRDEYEMGSASDIPEVLLPGHKWTQRVKPQFEQFGSTKPVEVIDFHLPTQSREEMENQVRSNSLEDGSYDWKIRYGSADPQVPRSNHTCSACGAYFHCQDQALPGFLPVDYFTEQAKYKFQECLCRRCYMLKHHQFLLNVGVTQLDYDKLLSHLKTLDDVLCVLIVDLLDLEGSIYRNLPSLIGYGKPMVVLGNKVDLLPPDGISGYLKRFRAALKNAVKQAGFLQEMNIVHFQIVSAKTGYGIEELITNIHTKWQNRGDIYLMGCTNAGKSTLFNRLLQSDLCKVRAVDLVERATTSIWPGTTLNLLRFPVMHMTPYRMVKRRQRLKIIHRRSDRDSQNRDFTRRGQEPLVLQGYVGTTFEGPPTDLGRRRVPESESQLGFAGEQPEERQLKYQPRLTDTRFTEGFWCHDTPGTVHSNQIINKLTLDELILMIPKETIMPRTYCMQADQSLLIAGLARVDVLQSASHQVLMTVFASKDLPVHVLNSSEVAGFMDDHWNTDLIKVPSGSAERWQAFPPLQGKELSIEGKSSEESSGDICLSSVGWVSIASTREVQLRAFTPGGVGIGMRSPALLPFAVMNRGKRIGGSAAYQVLPPRLPRDIEKRPPQMPYHPKNVKLKKMRKALKMAAKLQQEAKDGEQQFVENNETKE